MDLNNTNDTIAKMRAYIAFCDERIHEMTHYPNGTKVTAPDEGALAKHASNQKLAIQALHEMLHRKEEAAAKQGTPSANVIPKVIAVLDEFPEARDAVLRMLGGE